MTKIYAKVQHEDGTVTDEEIYDLSVDFDLLVCSDSKYYLNLKEVFPEVKDVFKIIEQNKWIKSLQDRIVELEKQVSKLESSNSLQHGLYGKLTGTP
jgi:hypothetical protein